MGRLLDTLYESMNHLKEEPLNIINEQFMMSIFSKYEEETPPFKQYKQHMCTKKNQFKIVRDESKLQPYHLLKKELFTPDDSSNIETDHLIEELGAILATSLLREFTDAQKATHHHLSAAKGRLSWAESSKEDKLVGLRMHANNNVSKSVFGGLTENITKYAMINLTHAGAMLQSRRNGDCAKELAYSRRKKVDIGMNALFLLLFFTYFYYS